MEKVSKPIRSQNTLNWFQIYIHKRYYNFFKVRITKMKPLYYWCLVQIIYTGSTKAERTIQAWLFPERIPGSHKQIQKLNLELCFETEYSKKIFFICLKTNLSGLCLQLQEEIRFILYWVSSPSLLCQFSAIIFLIGVSSLIKSRPSVN